MQHIDLRSDTVTKPTQAMRDAMAAAEVGDDVYGEDPTVNRLEELAAEMLGKEAAVFVPSGTQCNLIALLSHCQRGDEYIVGQDAHTYKYEAGGGAVFGSIQPQPLEFEPDGSLDLMKVEKKIKPDDSHFARTRLLSLENTQAGKVLPMTYQENAAAFAKIHNLKLHLDGARIFNAAVKLNIPVIDIAVYYDSVSFCLSKGLGAPVGSVLCGSVDFIHDARKWRKMAGGGMRQAGVIAAAGIVALEHHVDRLAEDHANAQRLEHGLTGIDELVIEPAQTNMVFVTVNARRAEVIEEFMQQRGISILGGTKIRLVTHLDVCAADIDSVIAAFKEFVQEVR